tara:strand:+ start:261 stop:494 length:234 start_codon:yes stop_codon:yes gene_type:complete
LISIKILEKKRYERIKENGTDKLSSTFIGEECSMYVATIAEIIAADKYKSIIKMITIDENKNAREPSRVLFLNFITP